MRLYETVCVKKYDPIKVFTVSGNTAFVLEECELSAIQQIQNRDLQFWLKLRHFADFSVYPGYLVLVQERNFYPCAANIEQDQQGQQ